MVCLGTAALAEEPKQIIVLPEVVITATGSESQAFAVPYTVNVFDAERLQSEEMARTVPEAFHETPGVMVQKTAHGQGSPVIRGFTGFRTLFLIDGIRLNNSTFRDGPNQYWNTVDPFTIQRMELIKGPSSVLYGSDAIGGTVNALSHSHSEWPDRLSADGRAYYRFASAENSHTGRAETDLGFYKQFSLFGGITMKSYGDLRAGDPTYTQEETGYRDWSADLKSEYNLTDKQKLLFAFQHLRQDDAWRTHRTIYAKSYDSTTIGTDLKLSYDQQRDLAYIQYHAEHVSSSIDTIKLSASYHFQGEDTDRVRSNLRRELAYVDVRTMGLWAQFTSPSPVGTWTYGTEYYRDWVSSAQITYNSNGTINSVAIQGPVADDANYDLFGVYVQDMIQLPKRWELILGGRYNYARADARKVRDPVTGLLTSVTGNWDSIVGSARAVWQIDQKDHWRVFGGVSQGFRAPNLSDLTRLDTARSGEIETAAPDLKPEDFITLETGVKTRFSNFTAEASYYYTIIDNMIVRAPTGNTVNGSAEVTKRNSGDGYINGIEASATWQFHKQFSVFGGITWMEGSVDGYPTSAPTTQREYISRLMPLTGDIGLRWDSGSRKLWSEGFVQMAAKQDKLSSSDIADTQRIPPGGTAGYAVLTLRGGWRINERFNVSAACENIFDKDYRVHGSGINEPGRNLVIALEGRF